MTTRDKRMGRWLYSALLYLIFPVILLILWYRGIKDPAYRGNIAQRFGHVPEAAEPGCIWVHAVSVGEALAAVPMIRRLMAQYPDRPMLVTTMTPTGAERVRAAFGDRVRQCYIPYDLPHMVNRFVRRVRPALLVIMETEVWPNVVHACASRNIPVVLANARLSRGSARGYGRVRPLVRPVFRQLTWIAAQAAPDESRFRELGVDPERMSVTGSIKYDVAVGRETRAMAEKQREELGGSRPVWIAASTHEGEDEAILRAHTGIRRNHPGALLILVPRHPERFDAVARLVEETGLSLARRSAGDSARDRAVYLADTMGELLMLFGVADVAFVGGSLIPRGGHNPLEPAAWSRPIVMGPHVFNFASVCERLEEQGGLVYVQGEEELGGQIEALFSDEDRRSSMGENARAVIAANRGAVERLVEGVGRLLPA